MGILDLSEFRDELTLVLGNQEQDATRLSRWVNFGYLELTSVVDFEILDKEYTFSTSIGTQAYAEPSDVLVIKLVRSNSQDKNLDWVGKEDLLRRPKGSSGAPRVWARFDGNILLHPVPDAVESMAVAYKTNPTVLSLDADKTAIPGQWDQAVILLAGVVGFSFLGEQDKSVALYNRAITYIKTQLIETGLHEHGVGLGLAQISVSPEGK